MAETKSWEKQPDETSLSYKAFRAFLDQPLPRRLYATSKIANVSVNSIKIWAKKFHWYERVDEYDNELGRVVDNTKSDALSTFRAQVMSDELEDYAALHAAWSLVFQKVLKQQSMELDDVLNALKRLAQIRVIVDNLGRKASQMPNTYRADEMERTLQDVTPDTIELTVNGPRIRLTAGDEDAT
jgi:hypothetical protein